METKVAEQIILDTTAQTEERSLVANQQSKQTELPKDTVTEINGVPVTTSLKIAEVFGKPHNDVLKRIRSAHENYKINEGKISHVSFPFVEAAYKDTKGEERPMFYLTEEGFSFVVMGFTGDKAALWKWKYISAFKAMQEKLSKKQQKPMTLAEITLNNCQAIVDLERKAIQHDQDIQDLKSAVSELQHPFNRSNSNLFRLNRQVGDHEERIQTIEAFSEDKGPAEAIRVLIEDAHARYPEYSYQDLYAQFYDTLRTQCGIKLSVRLSQLKKRRREQGWSESKIKKISLLDAITANPDIWEQVRGIIKAARDNWDNKTEE